MAVETRQQVDGAAHHTVAVIEVTKHSSIFQQQLC